MLVETYQHLLLLVAELPLRKVADMCPQTTVLMSIAAQFDGACAFLLNPLVVQLAVFVLRCFSGFVAFTMQVEGSTRIRLAHSRRYMGFMAFFPFCHGPCVYKHECVR